MIALLGQCHDRMASDVGARLRAMGAPLTLTYSKNVLRFLTGGPQRASQVVERCGLSKQAVSQLIAHLERGGYLTSQPDPDDQRARLLTITDSGRAANSMVEEAFGDVERGWLAELGERRVQTLRSVLNAVLAMPEPGPRTR